MASNINFLKKLGGVFGDQFLKTDFRNSNDMYVPHLICS
jgi:hypothetical protein